MSKSIRILAGALLLLLASGVALFASRDSWQSKATAQGQLPPGKWTYSASPYTGADYNTNPVVVTSVGTDSAEGLRTKIVQVKNRSSKPVAAIRLKWTLTTEQKPDVILQQGNTERITSDDGFPAGKTRVLKHTVVSFSEISKPLLKQGKLEGDYRLTVAVTEVFYADGSTWKEGQIDKSLSHASLATSSSSPPCPLQKCFFNSGTEAPTILAAQAEILSIALTA